TVSGGAVSTGKARSAVEAPSARVAAPAESEASARLLPGGASPARQLASKAIAAQAAVARKCVSVRRLRPRNGLRELIAGDIASSISVCAAVRVAEAPRRTMR